MKQALALARLTGASLTAVSVVEKLPAYAATIGEVADAKHEADAYFARIQAQAAERAPESVEGEWSDRRRNGRGQQEDRLVR